MTRVKQLKYMLKNTYNPTQVLEYFIKHFMTDPYFLEQCETTDEAFLDALTDQLFEELAAHPENAARMFVRYKDSSMIQGVIHSADLEILLVFFDDIQHGVVSVLDRRKSQPDGYVMGVIAKNRETLH